MFYEIYEQYGLIIPIIGILIMIGAMIVIPFSDYFKTRKLEKLSKLTTSQTQENLKRRKEDLEAKKKRDAEALFKLEKVYSDFLNSFERKYIEGFAKKFGNKANELEYLKLQSLLKNNEWDFSTFELKLLVEREAKKQHFERIKSNFLTDAHATNYEIIKIFLTNFGSEDETMLEILQEILKDKGTTFANLGDLKKEVLQVKSKIEAEEFANFLLSGAQVPDPLVVESTSLSTNPDKHRV